MKIGKMTAIFLLCLAVSSISCATLKTETSSFERLERNDENALLVKEAAEENKLRTKRDTGVGSTFVRWGRKTCPSGTSTVYVGIAGGKQYNENGSGTNRLCLTKSPDFDYTSWDRDQIGYLHGAEYQHIRNHHNHNVPCSVCRVPKSTTIMVPGTKNCPSGWTRQYYGHLTSANSKQAATEYVCLDYFQEDEDSGYKNEDGLLFFYVIASCGSLPCPPYRQSKVITCAVCSK